ncbi:hypothetical protein LTR56_025006 [Elasticomyces elasticus]|nr:hypothetical protein LTR56_025006 [Elasticomyces elasticus]KAK3645812.1 hypothetical protein LTR22_014580 [Elasticomyces elasticus]KAK4906611.1 hypothetical protein LTR49_024258 [Elasticomyces elasticus]
MVDNSLGFGRREQDVSGSADAVDSHGTFARGQLDCRSDNSNDRVRHILFTPPRKRKHEFDQEPPTKKSEPEKRPQLKAVRDLQQDTKTPARSVDALKSPMHLEKECSVLTHADSCGPEQDHFIRTTVKAEMEGDTIQHCPTQFAVGEDMESRGQTCSRCRMMDALVALYREKDMHAANALQARGQIERDEVDVAKLWMAAARYQEAARKRTDMIKREKQRESENVKQVALKVKEIGDLQRQLYPT